jgi:hypothetical protein
MVVLSLYEVAIPIDFSGWIQIISGYKLKVFNEKRWKIPSKNREGYEKSWKKREKYERKSLK